MKYLKIILFILLTFLLIEQVRAFDFEINSDKAILVNMTDDIVLFEKNADQKTSIASLTKIMTAITVLDNTNNLDEEVRITNDMLSGINGYAKAGFKVGNKVTIKELLYALMLPSAADAAQALAINQSGSIEEFVNLMNEEASKIGVENSHFSNPVGMDDDDNYSTARDLSIILIYCLKNPTFKEIYESNEYHIKALNKNVEKTIFNTAKIYDIDTSIIKGSKTGWTSEAEMCLSSTSTFNGTDYLLIVLNAKELSLDHITDTLNLYNYYKENYGYITIINNGDSLYTLKVKDSSQKQYEILASNDVTLYLKNNITKDDINIIFDGVDAIDNKFKKGDLLGTITVNYNDEILYIFEVYLETDIKFYNYKLYIGIGIMVLVLLFIIIFKIIKRVKANKKSAYFKTS